VRIIVGASSALITKKICAVSPSFDPVAFVALPPLAVAFSTNQYQPNF
jgi:hypothetical protein